MFFGKKRQTHCNFPALHFMDWQLVQGFPILNEVAFGLGMRALTNRRFLELQVSVHHAAECYRGAGERVQPIALWVAAEGNLSEPIPRCLASLIWVKSIDRAECYAALLSADTILDNPCSFATGADSETEPRVIVIEENHVCFAFGQLGLGDVRLRQLHREPSDGFWEAHGKRQDASQCFPMITC